MAGWHTRAWGFTCDQDSAGKGQTPAGAPRLRHGGDSSTEGQAQEKDASPTKPDDEGGQQVCPAFLFLCVCVCVRDTEFHSLIQAGVQWWGQESLQPQPPRAQVILPVQPSVSVWDYRQTSPCPAG